MALGFLTFSCFSFSDRVSLCSPDFSGICCVNQSILELTRLVLPLPPNCLVFSEIWWIDLIPCQCEKTVMCLPRFTVLTLES